MSLITRLFSHYPWGSLRPATRRMLEMDPFELTARELNALMEFPRWTINAKILPELNEQSKIEKNGFEVTMDVQQFQPDEITVKTVDDEIIVEGKHEERPDENGFISRHFVRKYSLPKGFDSKQIVSTLSSDGILTVKAPLPEEVLENLKERLVNIQYTGPARMKLEKGKESKSHNKEGKKEEDKDEKEEEKK